MKLRFIEGISPTWNHLCLSSRKFTTRQLAIKDSLHIERKAPLSKSFADLLERSRPSSPCFFFFTNARRKRKNISGADEISAIAESTRRDSSPPNKNIACAAIMRLSARNARVISVGSGSSRGVRGSIRIREQSGLGVSLTLESGGRFDHRFRKGSEKFFPSSSRPRRIEISRRSVENLKE